MQFKVLATLALGATLAAATGSPASQCNTGNLQCCQNTGTANDVSIASALALVGLVVQGVTGLVGVDCTPITVIGTGTTSCSAQPVCCTNNSFHGAVALGCSPVDLSL